MMSLTEKNLELWNLSQHTKGHGVIRPRLTRQETISSIIYTPPQELIDRCTIPGDYPVKILEVIPLENPSETINEH